MKHLIVILNSIQTDWYGLCHKTQLSKKIKFNLKKIRLLVEEGLNELPYSPNTIITPSGCEYEGVKYISGVCGVSIMRSGRYKKTTKKIKTKKFI